MIKLITLYNSVLFEKFIYFQCSLCNIFFQLNHILEKIVLKQEKLKIKANVSKKNFRKNSETQRLKF